MQLTNQDDINASIYTRNNASKFINFNVAWQNVLVFRLVSSALSIIRETLKNTGWEGKAEGRIEEEAKLMRCECV